MLQNVTKRNTSYDSLTVDFLLVGGVWQLGPKARRLHGSKLACCFHALTQSCCTNCQVYAASTKYDIMRFYPPFFLSKRWLLLFCLICCSCWHVWGEQHPSYNSFRSWIHCVVTGCSGLSLHFSISLAELHAVQCQKTNYRGIYPVLGLVFCYSALTELAWCTECAPLLVGQFSWHCTETCHHIFGQMHCAKRT